MFVCSFGVCTFTLGFNEVINGNVFSWCYQDLNAVRVLHKNQLQLNRYIHRTSIGTLCFVWTKFLLHNQQSHTHAVFIVHSLSLFILFSYSFSLVIGPLNDYRLCSIHYCCHPNQIFIVARVSWMANNNLQAFLNWFSIVWPSKVHRPTFETVHCSLFIYSLIQKKVKVTKITSFCSWKWTLISDLLMLMLQLLRN